MSHAIPQPQCKAKSKQKGTRCTKPCVPGMAVCRYHGGLSPRGAASPQFKHGRYSKYLPDRLQVHYETAAADPDLLSLRSELMLTDARLGELLATIGTGAGPERWQALATAHAALDAARRTGHTAGMAAALTELGALITDGARDGEVWQEIHAVINGRRRLVQTEARRLQQLHQMVTVERVLGLMTAVAESVRTHVQDQDTLVAIQGDLSRLLALPEARPA